MMRKLIPSKEKRSGAAETAGGDAAKTAGGTAAEIAAETADGTAAEIAVEAARKLQQLDLPSDDASLGGYPVFHQ